MGPSSEISDGSTFPIKTVVVLVQENRSFDHMLGWMKSLNPQINGVTGNESNPLPTAQNSTNVVLFGNKSHYVDPDPGHSIQDIYEQIFGAPWSQDSAGEKLEPSMQGFAANAERNEEGLSGAVMNGFLPEAVPVYKELVREFAVCDRWFASVPASTQPNRLFVHSATSHGATSNDTNKLIQGFPQKTIFESMDEAGYSFGIYYQYPPSTLFYRTRCILMRHGGVFLYPPSTLTTTPSPQKSPTVATTLDRDWSREDNVNPRPDRDDFSERLDRVLDSAQAWADSSSRLGPGDLSRRLAQAWAAFWTWPSPTVATTLDRDWSREDRVNPRLDRDDFSERSDRVLDSAQAWAHSSSRLGPGDLSRRLAQAWATFWTWPRNLRKLKYIKNFHQFDIHFKTHCKEGKLPNYVVVEQRYFDLKILPGNDDHPSHDVFEGQKFVKEVYEALRSSPQWNEMLFLIIYDEHGGFYDHVPTPVTGVPNPDGLIGPQPYNFQFDRLGVRVPVIMVSPWIERGKVVHGPTSGPFPNSEYEHSSIPATVKKIFNLNHFLTQRDAWAGTFETVITRTTPRTDCPETLAQPVKLRSAEAKEDANLTEYQKEMVQMAAVLCGDHMKEDYYPHKLVENMSVAKAADYSHQAFNKFLNDCENARQRGIHEDYSIVALSKEPPPPKTTPRKPKSFASKFLSCIACGR
nr:non-specific phospholipase C4-like [Ipomoea batatas]